MSKYPGILKFLGAEVPELPEPYRTGNAVDIYNYLHDPHNAAGNLEDFQQILNHQAVEIGNRQAKMAVVIHNSQLIRYFDNGGPSNTYGLTLPGPLGDLTHFYKPAQDATSQNINGVMTPVGPPTVIRPWTLPTDTILFTGGN